MMTPIGRTVYLLQKYEHPHIILETKELKELRSLLSNASSQIAEAVALRIEEEEK